MAVGSPDPDLPREVGPYSTAMARVDPRTSRANLMMATAPVSSSKPLVAQASRCVCTEMRQELLQPSRGTHGWARR